MRRLLVMHAKIPHVTFLGAGRILIPTFERLDVGVIKNTAGISYNGAQFFGCSPCFSYVSKEQNTAGDISCVVLYRGAVMLNNSSIASDSSLGRSGVVVSEGSSSEYSEVKVA